MADTKRDAPADPGARPPGSVEEIFHHASGLSGAERQAFLDAEVVPGSELRREVDSLLAHLDDESLPDLGLPDVDLNDDASPHTLPEQLGPYALERELGRGGMGVVCLAQDTRLRRKVAIKVLTAFGAGSPSLRARLLREAESASRLDHPAICKVYEVGEAEGSPYIVMQYVPGETLARRIAANRAAASSEGDAGATSTGPTRRAELNETLALVERVARAMHVAHEAGLVHRDVKPGNIMVTPAGDPVLLDFGLARDVEADAATLTRTGQLMGTPAYMAPEQLRGERSRIDRRTDVYALGVTLYECLTHRRPFEAPTREAMYSKILTTDPPDPRSLNRSLPRDLKVVLNTALDKEPARRYATAEAFAEDLRRVRAMEPIAARPVSTLGQVLRWAQRRPERAALVLVLALGIPALTGLGGYVLARFPDLEEQARLEVDRQVEEHLEEGFHYISHGENLEGEKALAGFDAALALRPENLEAIGGKALTLLRGDRAQECLDFLDEHADALQALPILRQLKADALRTLGSDEAAARLERGLPEPIAAVGFFLAGARLMKYCHFEQDKEAVFRRAESFFDRAILNSGSARPIYHFMLIHAARHLGDPDRIGPIADALARNWSDSFRAWWWVGCANGRVNPERSVEALRRSIDLNPDHTKSYTLLGRVLSRQGKEEEARNIFEQGIVVCRKDIEENPGSASAWIRMARLCRGAGREEDTLAALKRAAEVEPESYWPHNLLARELGNRGDLEKATVAFERSAELAPPDLGVPHFGVGQVYGMRKMWARAVPALEEGLKREPRRYDGWMQLGQSLRALGRFEDAAHAYERATELKPDYFAGHFNLGLVYRALKKWKAAMPHFRRAAELEPERYAAQSVLGQMLYLTHQHESAVEAFERCIRLLGDRFRYHHLHGVSLQRVGRLEDAVSSLRTACKQRPNDARTHVNLCRVLYQTERWEELSEVSERAARLDPRSHWPYYYRGAAASRLDRKKEAARAFVSVIRRGYRMPHVYLLLGGALIESRDYERAFEWLRKGQTMDREDATGRVTDEHVRECERMVDLVPKLEGVLRGEIEEKDAVNQRTLAAIAEIEKRYGAAASLYEQVFASDSALADAIKPFTHQSYRFAASCSAAACAVGKGMDAGNFEAEDRIRWRRQALDWLREELWALRTGLAAGRLTRDALRERLAECSDCAWKKHPLLAAVREEGALEELPDSERVQWVALWQAVDELVRSTK